MSRRQIGEVLFGALPDRRERFAVAQVPPIVGVLGFMSGERGAERLYFDRESLPLGRRHVHRLLRAPEH